MKKYLVVFFALFCASISSADIFINAEGKIQKYPDGSTLNITAAKNVSVQYQNVRIFIPKGEEISLRCSGEDENYIIFASGKVFSGIKIGSYTISSKTPVSITINSLTGEIVVEKGSLEITDSKGNVAILSQGDSYKTDVLSFQMDGFLPKNKYQHRQAEQDLILSPSAPHN